MLAEVVIYTTVMCKGCQDAKELLNKYGIRYQEHNVEKNYDKYKEMQKITGKKTVPQILYKGKPIGGKYELQQYLSSGTIRKIPVTLKKRKVTKVSPKKPTLTKVSHQK